MPGFVITQTFAEHVARREREGYQYYNGGLDLAYPTVKYQAPVYAAAPGQVIEAGWNDKGYGNYVKLQHVDGYVTLYAHLDSLAVRTSTDVDNMAIIGYLGHTGFCTGGPGNPDGVHLHFELRKDNVPIDPMPYMVAR